MYSMNFTSCSKQLLSLLVLLFFSQTLSAADNKASDLQQITADNESQLVSQIGSDYYQQLESLVNFYQLYQQKRDPRGFNVWHLRGFSPAFNERQAYYQELLATAAPESLTTAEKIVAIFDALETISTQLMISFRENDPAAYQQAKTLIAENNDAMAKLLAQYQHEADIRTINLN